MNNSKYPFLFIYMSLVFLFSACNFPSFSAVRGDGVRIISPLDGARLSLGDSVEIISEVSASGGGSVQHLNVNSQLYRSDTFTAELTAGSVYQPWVPPAPGEYILQVIVETHGGDKLISVPVTVYVDESKGETPTPTETQTTPTATATVTPTATSETTTATAEINLNCRVGPSYDHGTIDGLRQGETSPIVGVNSQRTWGLIEGPHSPTRCWVPLDYTIIVGDISRLLVHSAPPPEPGPTKKVDPTKTPTKTPGGPTTP